MADGLAPAVDKVGPPAPGAPESETQAPAPSGLSGAAPAFKPSSAPTGSSIPGLTAAAPASVEPAAETVPEKSAPPPVEEKKLEHGAGGAGPALSAPKPVEIMSGPDTPINGSTPAGGTPRPELNIPTEKIEIPKSSVEPTSDAQQTPVPAVSTGVQEPAPTPSVSLPKETSIPEPIKDSPSGPGLNGKPAGEPAEMTGAIQTQQESAPAAPSTLKRKFEDEKPTETVNGGGIPQPESERVEKKAKLDEPAVVSTANDTTSKPEEHSASTTTESSTNNDSGKANGRAKRGMGKRAKKIAETIVGKTARKTRSQGPA